MTESEHQIRVNNLLQSDLWKNVGDELRRDDTTQGTKSPSASELEKLLNEVLNDKSLLSEEAALLAAKQGLNDIPLFMTPLGNHLGYEADEADAEEGKNCDLPDTVSVDQHRQVLYLPYAVKECLDSALRCLGSCI